MKVTIHKAITAAVFTLAGAVGAALMDGDLTLAEVLTAAGTALLAGYGTWRVPYFTEDPEGRHRGPGTVYGVPEDHRGG